MTPPPPPAAASHTLAPGTTLRGGAYCIVKVLGQGGFGITYLATAPVAAGTGAGESTMQVAIKEFFPKEYCGRMPGSTHVTLGAAQQAYVQVPRLRSKFVSEARNLASFNHPGIVRIHDVFEENATAYYVMDYVPGMTLHQLVTTVAGKKLPPALATAIVGAVGDALSHVHSKRVTHLDVKPANIMVYRDAGGQVRPMLIDFGLAKQYRDNNNQVSTTPVGVSEGYAPFEQYNSRGVAEFSPRTDVYSLAATLYFTLTGTVPPSATYLTEHGLDLRPLPSWLGRVIEKAMMTRRQDRWETVRSFVAAFPVNNAPGYRPVNWAAYGIAWPDGDKTPLPTPGPTPGPKPTPGPTPTPTPTPTPIPTPLPPIVKNRKWPTWLKVILLILFTIACLLVFIMFLAAI